MDHSQIDLFSVFLAALVNMAIGFFWYSRWLFGELWMELSDATLEKKSFAIVWSFLAAIVTAYVLAFLQMLLGVTTVSDGMFVGFLAWIGFVATTQISEVIWGEAPFKLFLLETGCKLLILLAMGGILGA